MSMLYSRKQTSDALKNYALYASIFNQKKVKGIFSEVVQVKIQGVTDFRVIVLWFTSAGGCLVTKKHSCAQNLAKTASRKQV